MCVTCFSCPAYMYDILVVRLILLYLYICRSAFSNSHVPATRLEPLRSRCLNISRGWWTYEHPSSRGLQMSWIRV